MGLRKAVLRDYQGMLWRKRGKMTVNCFRALLGQEEVGRRPASSLAPPGEMLSSGSGSLFVYCLPLVHQFVYVCQFMSVLLFRCLNVVLCFMFKRKKMVKTLSAGRLPLDLVLTHFKKVKIKKQRQLAFGALHL
jgi:hypothetical protein